MKRLLQVIVLLAAVSPALYAAEVQAPVYCYSDGYLEGYIKCILDEFYTPCNVNVVVKKGHVYLSEVPNICIFRENIIHQIKRLPGVCSVQIVECPPEDCPALAPIKWAECHKPRIEGVWFPFLLENILFDPFIADPRQVQYSAAYRAGDKAISPVVAAVSFGDEIPIYRWCNVLPWKGDLQIGIEGGLWAVFDMDSPSHDLINADYYCGIPVTYAFKKWSFRSRLYHISSHLGDEYLVLNPDVLRTNPSIEVLDLYVSYRLNNQIRLYGGIADYFISDPTFRQRPLVFIYGTEIKFVLYEDICRNLIWKPFLAIFLQNKEMNDWRIDQTYAFGVELGQIDGWARKVRFMIEWHDGYSQEGQLQRLSTSYGQLKLQYCY
ncbi:MAG: DUF1207 domain-containing protein [Chlamydiota bacterium]